MSAAVWGAVLLAASLETTTMTLSVQLVDKGWMPVPGVEVSVQRVDSCAGLASSIPAPTTSATNKTGWVDFPVEAAASYRIAVKSQGGFKGVSKCVRLYARVPTQPQAYVQLQLQVKVP